MKNGFIEWPNKALYRISDLRPKREKMRNDNKCVGQTRPYNEFKRPKLVFGCSFLEQITFFEEERGEWGEEN